MPRSVAVLLFAVIAVLSVVGGMLLERSGVAASAIDRLYAALPERAQEEVERVAPELAESEPAPAPIPGPEPTLTPIGRPETIPAPPAGLYWGVHLEAAPFDPAPLETFVDDLGDAPAIVMWFQEWAGRPRFPVAEARVLAQRGIVPMVTWEAWAPPPVSPSLNPEDVLKESRQPAFRLSRITEGEYDDYIRSYAEDVKAAGVPVMLRPFHEMNGFWYPWGGTVNGNRPRDVVAAWRHVHGIFDEVGADGVTWVWSVNHRSLPDEPRNRVAAYWPGAAYVDWIGVSGFNYGTTSSVSSWQPLERIVSEVLDTVESYGLPVMLAETATVHEGGDEGEWIARAFDFVLQERPEVDAVVWFERRMADVRDFRLTSSPAALKVFRDAIDGGAVMGAPRAFPGWASEGDRAN